MSTQSNHDLASDAAMGIGGVDKTSQRPWSLSGDGAICLNGRAIHPTRVVEALNEYQPQANAHDDLVESLWAVEEILGYNVVWLQDTCDLALRQGDETAERRLAALNNAHKIVCAALRKAGVL